LHEESLKNDSGYKVKGNCIVENKFQYVHQSYTPIDIIYEKLHEKLGAHKLFKDHLHNVASQEMIEDMNREEYLCCGYKFENYGHLFGKEMNSKQ
jgi:hypothetical protein